MAITTNLKSPFSAYLRDRSTAIDDELQPVGRGTPGGEYLRRYWQPVALSSQIGTRPFALRIMGEDLVAFRDGDGRVGVLERACCHRGTSLEFGKVESRGIRCCYHGWLFDADGAILETPGEPPGSRVADKVFQGAYPTREWMGLVFAYMGPPEACPPFPIYDAFERSDAQFVHRYRHSPCNWLQIRENEMDPIHLTFLHTRVFGTQFTEVYGEIPTIEWIETEHGMVYLTVRRWGENLYLRVNDMLMPNIARIAGIEDAESETLFDRRGSALNWTVPIDDVNTLVIGVGDIDKTLEIPDSDAYPDRMQRSGAYTVGAGDIGQTGERSYEERQSAPGDWDAWVSQGKMSNHRREHLGLTDRGIVLFRRLTRDGVRAVAQGKDPKGLLSDQGTAPILTYCHNTVLRVPPAPTEAEEHRQQIAFGRRIYERIRKGDLSKDRPGTASLAERN